MTDTFLGTCEVHGLPLLQMWDGIACSRCIREYRESSKSTVNYP